jgi:hypothetical protein
MVAIMSQIKEGWDLTKTMFLYGIQTWLYEEQHTNFDMYSVSIYLIYY